MFNSSMLSSLLSVSCIFQDAEKIYLRIQKLIIGSLHSNLIGVIVGLIKCFKTARLVYLFHILELLTVYNDINHLIFDKTYNDWQIAYSYIHLCISVFYVFTKREKRYKHTF